MHFARMSLRILKLLKMVEKTYRLDKDLIMVTGWSKWLSIINQVWRKQLGNLEADAMCKPWLHTGSKGRGEKHWTMLRHRIEEAFEVDWWKDIKEARTCVRPVNVVFAHSWRLVSTTL